MTSLTIRLFLLFTVMFLHNAKANVSEDDLPSIRDLKSADWNDRKQIISLFRPILEPFILPESKGNYEGGKIEDLFVGALFPIDNMLFKTTLRKENSGRYGIRMMPPIKADHSGFSCGRLTEKLIGKYGKPDVKNDKSFGNKEIINTHWLFEKSAIESRCALFTFKNGMKFPLSFIFIRAKDDTDLMKPIVRLSCTANQRIGDEKEFKTLPPITIIVDPTDNSVDASYKTGKVVIFDESRIKTKFEEVTDDGLAVSGELNLDRFSGKYTYSVSGKREDFETSQNYWGACQVVSKKPMF